MPSVSCFNGEALLKLIFRYLFLPKLRAVTKIQASFFSIWFQTFTYSYRFTSKSHWAKVLKNVSVNIIKKKKKNQHVRQKKDHICSESLKVNLMAKLYLISAEFILLLLYFLTNRLDITLVKYSHHCGEEALYQWQIYHDFCWRFLWVLMCWNIFMTQSQQK